MQTPTDPQPLPAQITLQFSPCGHICKTTGLELVKNYGSDQYDAIMAQVSDLKKLDAPTLNQRDCPTCKEQKRRDEQAARELGLNDPSDRFNILH